MKFTKMQGLGNDYLYVYGEVPEQIAELSRRLSDRHFGPGADGMIYISPSSCADFQMRIFNADGSEAKMCGNGIRCVGKYVYDKGYTDKTRLSVETLSGIKYLDMQVVGGKVKSVQVDMGKAEVGEVQQLKLPSNEDASCCAQDNLWSYTPVSVGNPHAVFFVADAEQIPLEKIGPRVEHHADFPGGVNAEFVQVIQDNELRMRVWERGSGITMACGTGACASTAAAVQQGFCSFDTPVRVHLDGGDLIIKISRAFDVQMSGPAEFVYEGDSIC